MGRKVIGNGSWLNIKADLNANYEEVYTGKVDKDGTKVLSDQNFTTVLKTKVDGVAAGATANDTDTNLKNRANHVGSQPIATVTGLSAALLAKIEKVNGLIPVADLPPFEVDTAQFQGAGTTASPLQIKIAQLVTAFFAGLPGYVGDGSKSLRDNLTWGASGTTEVQLATSTLTAGTPGATSVVLSWTSVVNATAYVIERSANGTTGWAIVYTGALLTFTDSGLANSTQYFYRLKATATGYTNSAYSSVNITTAAASSYTLEQTIIVNFANEFFSEVISGVNQFKPTAIQAGMAAGYSLLDMVNASNAATTVDIAIGNAFYNASNSTGSAIDSASIYTDLMVNSGLTVSNGSTPSSLIISGLDNTKYYHFYITAAGSQANASAKFGIGVIEQTKVTSNNYPLAASGNKYTNPAIVRFYNLTPVGGSITIDITEMGSVFEQTGINVLEIERSNVVKTA